jgi:DNA polymerase-1
MPRALIVHATHLLWRGYQVVSTDRHDPAGQPVNALFALTAALGRALAFKTPDVALAVLDSSPAADAPALLAPQLDALGPLLEAHGFTLVPSAEPADLVASYAHAAIAAGHDVVVVGSDKRLAQLVDEQVWWYDAYKDVRYTPELVRKRFEVAPSEVAGWLALVGDDDTLKGIKGIGKKGATDLVKAFGSIDAALDVAATLEGRSGKMLRASLAEAREQVARARLDAHRPLPMPLGELRYRPPEPAALDQRYAELGFFELLADHAGADEVAVTLCDTPAAALEALASLPPTPIALHVIADDPSPVRGALVGLALAAGDGAALYFPFAGRGRRLESPEVLAAWLGDASRPKVGHDVKAACVAFGRHGIAIDGIVGDSACASHLTEPSNWATHDLALVARLRLQRVLPSDDSVRGVGRRQKAWSAIAVERAAAHAAAMADAAAALWQSFAPTVPRALLDEYLALSETLVRMEQHGIACDAAELLRAGDDFAAAAAKLQDEIHALAGKRFNLGSTKQLGAVLYEDLGLPIVKRTKTGWSTATDALERIQHEHPIVALVIRWRELVRLKDNWVTALVANIDDDGRVRSTFHPARSFTGRLVNTQPDLGRVPGRTSEMERIRRAFRVPPGSTLLSLDYNQLGLYVLAHLTRDPALVEPLRDGADLHRLTAAAVLEVSAEEVTPDQRQIGKVVNFATFAGQGASALALILGMSAQEAKVLIERFDRRYAVVRAFQDEQLRLARERGYVETVAGRRWPIGGLAALDPLFRSQAERMARRATHEGSVADVSRRGLLRADQALRAAGLRAAPLLQVHDEVLFEVPDDEVDASAGVAADAMRHAFALEVPLRVGCKAGPSWGELVPLAVT